MSYGNTERASESLEGPVYFLILTCVCVCLAESESDAEKILFSYGFGAQLPTTARRRAQQRCFTSVCIGASEKLLCFSVRLAQRVLQLERVNSALRRDSEVERARSKKLQEEVCTCSTILGCLSSLFQGLHCYCHQLVKFLSFSK